VDQSVSIIIPAFNEAHYCAQCINSILENTSYPYHLILVDNGSTDGVPELFDSVTGATVVHAETNLGFAGGVNLGLERAEGHVLLLNSDTLVPRGWLGRLVQALAGAEDIGAVGPMSNWVAGPQLIPDLDFQSLENVSLFADVLANKRRGRLTDVPRLVGFCMLIRDTVIEQVGPFDESFGIGNYEDDDYCVRIRQAGHRLCIAHDCFVFHYGSRTFIGMGITDEKQRTLLAKNQQRFIEKWQISDGDRLEAIEKARQLNRDARAALEGSDTAKAIRILTEAVKIYPHVEVNHNDLGAVLWDLGKHERAYDCFRRAVRLNPLYAEAKENLHDAAAHLGRTGEIEDAMANPGGFS